MVEAVVDTSPLVFLAAVDQLALLRVVAERVVVPLPVMEELLVRGPEDVTVRAIRANAWIEVVESPYPSEAVLAWDLGRGETSVLAGQIRGECRGHH